MLRWGDARVLVVAPLLRGDGQFDGLLSTTVTLDGFNATDALCRMILGSKYLPQLHYLMLGGITLGGFNVVDLPRLSQETGLSVMALTRRPPDLPRVLWAIRLLPQPDRRQELILRAGPLLSISGLSCQLHGLDVEEARALIQVTRKVGHLPEPLRMAYLIAGGLVLGQPGCRA